MMQVVGIATPRVEGELKVTGKAQYSADVKLPGTLWGKCLRSPITYGRIKSIDTSKAWQVPGVKAVITGMRPPIRRKGMIRQSRNSKWSAPLKICSMPSLTNPTDAWYHAGSRATRPDPPVIIIARLLWPSGI